MKKTSIVFAALLLLLLTGCLSGKALRAIAPPHEISIHVVSGNAIISGEMTSNPNVFRDAEKRSFYERFSRADSIKKSYFAEGTTFFYSIPYGNVLMLTVQPFSATTKENPLVIEVNDEGTITTYNIYGFEASQFLRFTNDYYID